MCGLAGLFGSSGADWTREVLQEMLRVQGHRGPDATGTWCEAVDGVNVGLGLSRLKILDLSDAANQPMATEDGRFILVYNGEIYNYLELRDELTRGGIVFRTNSDTEVVLQSLISWGPPAFARFNGMWSLALLDRAAGDVLLSRDRFGVKPLYYYSDARELFISSEIKAILRARHKKFNVNLEVVNAFLTQNLLCTSANTFFLEVKEFPAGHWARIPLNGIGKSLITTRYWDVSSCPPTDLNENTLVDLVRTTFIDSVKIRLRSDVPVGVLLSGGTDSSAIASVINYLYPSRNDIRLLSAVAASGNDEQPFIDIMANHMKREVDKVVLDYRASKALDLITEVTWFNDEPIHNFSTVAHYLLMARARELGITVLLSGQGADEILCGYKKYLGFYIQELLRSGKWLRAVQVTSSFFSRGTVLSQIDYQETKRYLPRWLRLPELDIRGPRLREMNQRIAVGLNGRGLIGRQIVDIERLSVPALVHYEDRTSMAMAREVRLPFLDYRFVSLLLSLPVNYKLRDGWTKWIFRRAMETLLPKEIAWRKDKQSFIVPQNEWLRSELRSDVAHLLKEEWMTEQLGLVDRHRVQARYEAYVRQDVKGRISFKDIMSPVALELWARRFQQYLAAS